MSEDTVKPRAFDHRSKMRLLEHGTEWVLTGRSAMIAGKSSLLLMAKDGYLKWWPEEHIE